MRGRTALAAACFTVIAGTVGGGAAAHETQTAGPLRLTVGWASEPALAGAPNAIELAVSDSGGASVTDPAASLTVDVTFGAEKLVRPLAPAGAGRFQAALIPTRAGTYAFRVHGTLRGESVDITSTCSDRTFDCVKNPSEIQFPAKDPSPGELAARLEREVARIEAKEPGRDPLPLALAGAAVVLAAVAVAVGIGARNR